MQLAPAKHNCLKLKRSEDVDNATDTLSGNWGEEFILIEDKDIRQLNMFTDLGGTG